MAVRNFWIEVEIDGRKTKLTGGPTGKNGGMVIVLYQRQEGKIIQPIRIHCDTLTDTKTGEISLCMSVHNSNKDDPNFADSWGYCVPMRVITKR